MVKALIFGLVVVALALPATTLNPQGDPLQRPDIKPWPRSPGYSFPPSPARTKSCKVVPSSSGDGDDAPQILEAFHDCNNGGTVILDANYTIASPLDLTFLESVDVAILGTINFSGDVDYWIVHSFKYVYQASSAMWRFGGKDVNIYGNSIGLINGNGQPWYERFAQNATLQRPVLLVLDGLQGGSVSGLAMEYPPSWFNWIANSSDILVSDMDLSGNSANTDGWDTYRSNNVVIQNSAINNGDDCVSFKPNSTNIVVQGLVCNGSHGISVGSLGQYVEEYDIVENVYVYNISMSDASDGARIKVWPGIDTPFQPSLSGGGGAGYVKNVTYELFYNSNNDWAIEIDQCHGQSNQSLCDEYPSNMTISDVYFKSMWGITSKAHDPDVGTLVCSSPEQCQNIQAHNISVSPPSGETAEWICTNLNTSNLQINCVSS